MISTVLQDRGWVLWSSSKINCVISCWINMYIMYWIMLLYHKYVNTEDQKWMTIDCYELEFKVPRTAYIDTNKIPLFLILMLKSNWDDFHVARSNQSSQYQGKLTSLTNLWCKEWRCRWLWWRSGLRSRRPLHICRHPNFPWPLWSMKAVPLPHFEPPPYTMAQREIQSGCYKSIGYLIWQNYHGQPLLEKSCSRI